MSKGAYSVVTYPVSSDIDKVLNRFRGSGACCMWILHDKDKNDNGTPKDHHFHIAAGWEKGFPTWKNFLEFCKICDTELFTGDCEKYKDPHIFAKLMPEKVRVHDAAALEEYFLHKDSKSRAAGKYEYSPEELYKDSGWLGSLYDSADFTRNKQRKAKKDDAAADNLRLFDIIRTQGFTEWFELIDYVCSQCSELVPAVMSGAYPVKSYMDSMRQSHCIRSQLQKENDFLHGEVARLQKELRELEEVDELRRKWMQAVIESKGETLPLWEIP